MADKPQQETRLQNGVDTEPTARAAAPAVRSTAQEGTQQEAGAERGRHAARTPRRSRAAGSETGREQGQAGAETMRHLGQAASEAMQRSSEAAATGQRTLAHTAAEQLEGMGARMAQAMQESARDLRTLFALPNIANGGMQEAGESVSGLVEGVLRANMRMAQELFRMTNPVSAIDLQRRFGAECLDTMLHSSALLLRAARRAADDALRPLEERLEQRGLQQHRETQPGKGQEPHGCVADVMETELRMASPEDTVQHAAQMMRETDAGALPVGEGDRLVGMLTDHDVAVHLAAEGRDPRQTRVREVMTPEVRFVFEDEDLEDVAENMAEQQVRRLPVMSREKRVVGVISLADLARKGRAPFAGAATA